MVDPNAPQGLPPGVPPDPSMGGPGAPAGPAGPAGQAGGLPTTDPNALMQIIAAILSQDEQEFVAQQQQALGTAVTQLLQMQPNAAGQAASTMPGPPVPPPMPQGGSGAGPDPQADPSAVGSGGY